MHNSVLLGIAEVILRSHIDLCVRHIEGKLNIQADLLSCLLLDDFACQFPDTHFCLFDPPHDLLRRDGGCAFEGIGQAFLPHAACSPTMSLDALDDHT